MIEFSNHQFAGYLPSFLSEDDPRGAVDQISSNYVSGWNEFKGFKLTDNETIGCMLWYPGDPPMMERARGKLRDETVVLFDYDWVAVIQKDGSYRVARID